MAHIAHRHSLERRLYFKLGVSFTSARTIDPDRGQPLVLLLIGLKKAQQKFHYLFDRVVYILTETYKRIVYKELVTYRLTRQDYTLPR